MKLRQCPAARLLDLVVMYFIFFDGLLRTVVLPIPSDLTAHLRANIPSYQPLLGEGVPLCP